MKPITIAVVLCAAVIAGCHSAPVAPAAPAAPAVPVAQDERGYTLVLLQTGPMSGRLSQEENGRVFAGHFANMERMAAEGQLVVAGPYGEQRHDANLRGLFVLDTSQRAEAEAWAGTDPPTQAGVFVLAYHDLATDAPLRRAVEADTAWRAEQLAQGRVPSPGEGARPYVLLTAEHGELAQRVLSPLCTSDGGVFLLARLDGTRTFALLDAENLAAAQERFGPELEALGSHVLDEWYASEQLAHLPEWSAR